jgi:hypothetical protein
VAAVVVEYDMQVRTFLKRASISDLLQELAHLLLRRTVAQHVNKPAQERTDCTIDGYASETVLVQHYLHRVLFCRPGV